MAHTVYTAEVSVMCDCLSVYRGCLLVADRYSRRNSVRQEPVGDSCLLTVFPVCAILISAARVILFSLSRHLDDSKLCLYSRAYILRQSACTHVMWRITQISCDVRLRCY